MARIRGGAGVVQDALYPDPIYNNQLQEDSFSDRSYEDLGGVHPPRTHSGLQSIMPHDIPNFREDVDINYSNAYPQPFERPNMLDVSGQVGEYSQRPGQIPYPTSQKRSLKDIFSGGLANIKKGGEMAFGPLMMMANAVNPLSPNSQNFNPMLEGQLQNYTDQGFRVNEQGQAIDGPLAGKNLVSGFGTNDVTQMLRNRLQKIRTRKIAQTTSSKAKQKEIRAAIDAQVRAENAGYQGTRGGNTGSGVFAKIDNSGKTYGPYSGNQGGGKDLGNKSGNYGAAQGTKGSWNPGARKDGGRIGYENGELVEQETDFIEGPQGGEEFQETVVEGQEQPSREQLEALAMEIFQLPLEELDEQQLVVVYQEAMQGQPMEEAVQEEDVQFAANGGLASLL